jgi:AraC family transcriptional regulator of adaptative response / DNA-3-methyladenine glycosylase II
VARIRAGALNEGSFESLAAEMHLSSRHLRRAIEQEYGISPIELAQTQRLLLAKQLLTDTSLRVADVAYASGFASLRRFNHLFQARYRLTPTTLRRQRQDVEQEQQAESFSVHLSYRPPLDWPLLAGFLVGRGAPGVERLDGGRYLRTIRIGEHRGWIVAEPVPGRDQIRVEISSGLLPVLTPLLARLRALFDLDAVPSAIIESLSQDPLLKQLVKERPGLRVPGAFDGFELALRAILGQQVSVKAATTLFGRFAEAFGEPLQTPHPGLIQSGPAAERVAQASVDQLAKLGLPRTRAASVKALARAAADGLRIEAGGDVEATTARLKELPGIGDWTAQYVAMRALRDADAFPASDLAILKALGVRKAGEAIARAERWRPWRAYAVLHLWMQAAAGG